MNSQLNKLINICGITNEDEKIKVRVRSDLENVIKRVMSTTSDLIDDNIEQNLETKMKGGKEDE